MVVYVYVPFHYGGRMEREKREVDLSMSVEMCIFAG